MELNSTLNLIVIVLALVLLILLISVGVISLQILTVLKRILVKIEFHIDNLKLTEEEIKIKILSFIESLLTKMKSYRSQKPERG